MDFRKVITRGDKHKKPEEEVKKGFDGPLTRHGPYT